MAERLRNRHRYENAPLKRVAAKHRDDAMRNRRYRKTGMWPMSNICTIGANVWFVTRGGGDGDANRRVMPSRAAAAVAMSVGCRDVRRPPSWPPAVACARASACFRSGRPAKHEAAAIETPLLAPLAAASLAHARSRR